MIPIRDTLPRRNKPIATYLLILINAIVFLFELTMPPPELEQVFNMSGWYRLASCTPTGRLRRVIQATLTGHS